ncbi:MAG TPA: hypothetical protein ENI44_01595 [Thermoplasmatales archaeon]|nr:hypothetical protein [Thermoplasmatales archaeon]
MLRYTVKPFSKQRENITLIAAEGWRKHSIHALVEMDVTYARELIKKHWEETGEKLSFTAWLIRCVAKAVSENNTLNTYRHGRRRMVVFENIDVAIPVERSAEGEFRPRGYVIKDADEKTLRELAEEIRSLQNEEVDASKEVLGRKLSGFEKFVIKSPMFIKKLLLPILRRNAILKTKHMGTVGLTSVGSVGNIKGWILPSGGLSTTLVAVGGITNKLVMIDGNIEEHEILHLTVTVDHDIVDGGPLARFIERLRDLVENAFELEDLTRKKSL